MPVLEDCRNARFDLKLKNVNPDVYLSAIGKQLDRVCFEQNSDGSGEHPDLTNSWDKFPNVQEVTILGPSQVREVEALVNSPKLFFKTLELGFHRAGINNKAPMNAISAGWITTLESVAFTCLLPTENVFESLVRMNKSLHKVEIEIYILEITGMSVFYEIITNIVKCFFQAPALARLTIVVPNSHRRNIEIPEVEELCRVNYRHRRVYIMILGNIYS